MVTIWIGPSRGGFGGGNSSQLKVPDFFHTMKRAYWAILGKLD